jgi:hypothetical protein
MYKYPYWNKKLMLRKMVKRRLDGIGGSTKVLEQKIRCACPDAPVHLQKYPLFEWFVHHAPLKKKNARTVGY